MARTRYLISYDIADPRRLRSIAKICESYGSRIQYSVFECPLDELKLESLKADLLEIINHENDQVLFISLGPEESPFRIESMGLPYTQRARITII